MPAPLESVSFGEHSVLLLESHLRVVGRPLLDVGGTAAERARALYFAPFVLLSHGTEHDPLFCYANAAATSLFEFEWEEFVGLPSRLSAEAANHEKRQRLLDAVSSRGYVDGYEGIRISRSGKRFRIVDATVWNLIDASGQRHGQAATFARWTPVQAAG